MSHERVLVYNVLKDKLNFYTGKNYTDNEFENTYFSGSEFIFITDTNRNQLQKINKELNQNNINSIVKKSSNVNFDLDEDNRNIYFKDKTLKV